MADRTIKMYGKAYGSNVSITVNFNNTEVFNGTVTSTDTDYDYTVPWIDMDELCSFTVSTDLTGDVPVSILVNGGVLVYHTAHANYGGPVFSFEYPNPDTLVTATVDNYEELGIGHTDFGVTDDGKTNVQVEGVDVVPDPSYTGGVESVLAFDGETITFNQWVTTAVTSDVFPFNV